MEKLGTLCLSFILLSLTQIQYTCAECTGKITSVKSTTASSLTVQWTITGSMFTSFILDLRVVNNTSVAPVMVTLTKSTRNKIVQGLQPGSTYEITLKVFYFVDMICKDNKTALTVPATSQITLSKAISSTTLIFEWEKVTGADEYILFVERLFEPKTKVNGTFSSLGGQIDGLQPSTPYNCFVFSSNRAGLGASSNIKTITTLVQPPGGVVIVSTGNRTARLTWLTVPSVLRYQVRVTDEDDPSVASTIKNTSSTSMDISGLQPCSNYTVGVSSLNAFGVSGEASNVTYNTSTIEKVTSITADYTCSGRMVTVTWGEVLGANSYRASVLGSNGTSLSCNSTSTSCQITMLDCGERYHVQVEAISDDCISTSNIPKYFETGPCPPVNLKLMNPCGSNVIIFTWDATNNTASYVATSVAQDGTPRECRTGGTKCFFTSNIVCGNEYTFTVYSVSECNSGPSESVMIQTSPCLPASIRTLAQCSSENLTANWDVAAGALSYLVEAQGNNGDNYNCTTNKTSCALASVACGEVLSIYLTASNKRCPTRRILGEPAETVPCVPINVTASTDCRPDSATIKWVNSRGAAFYIAVATNAAGTTRSCMAVSTMCVIKGLGCSQTYNATVVGTNSKCNSSLSEQVSIQTAPCPPVSVEGLRDCENNKAVIKWQSERPTGSYVVTIEDQDGGLLGCNSTDVKNCTIQAPRCGQTYSINITYDDGRCNVTSAPVNMESVPCALKDLTASVACDTGLLTADWTAAPTEQNYTTVITSGAGERVLCNSTRPQCVQEGLACGRAYQVTVFTVQGSCFGLPGAEVSVQQVPCAPSDVTATRSCGDDQGTDIKVTWSASLGADRYTAFTVGFNCSTVGTSCSLNGLLCGRVYTVAVVAADANCTSQQSMTVTLSTVPCPPVNLASVLDCSTGSALLSWSHSPNAVSYNATAVGPGVASLPCNSNTTSCQLNGLVCGQVYNLSVTASDGTCVSNYSAPLSQESAPCAPVNVQTNLNCITKKLTVSWDLAAELLNYTVYARAREHPVVKCYGTAVASSCDLSGLQCGQEYNVTVMAARGSCNGSISAPRTVRSVPCVPENLVGTVECNSDRLQISWSAAPGATRYLSQIMGPDGYYRGKDTTALNGSYSGLRCGSKYDITVRSQDDQCNSSVSQASVTTAPCDPVNVISVLECDTNMASVSWNASTGAVAYTVLADWQRGWCVSNSSSWCRRSCSSINTSCQLSQLRCGSKYNLTVLAQGQGSCNSTGKTSSVLTTAPCPPTDLSSKLLCGSDSASLSWAVTVAATGYEASASSSSGGPPAACNSTAGAAATCVLTDLRCGETYTATVTAKDDQCSSSPSADYIFHTALCPPTNLRGEVNCSASLLSLLWDASPVPGASYILHSQKLGGDNATTEYPTPNTNLSINLPCGEKYAFSIAASDATCNSSLSLPVELDTAPCPPSGLVARVDCGANRAHLSWAESGGATYYVAEVTGEHGHGDSCVTNGTSCSVRLLCGRMYNATVVAATASCNSSLHAAVEFDSEPCVPANVQASVNCESEDVSVSWDPSDGSNYTVVVQGNAGFPSSCNTSGQVCVFNNLLCGHEYNITVSANEGSCRSDHSSPITVKTVPCEPQNVSAVLDCNNNTAVVSWETSERALLHHVTAVGTDGHNISCSSSSDSCTLPSMHCGQRYNLNVTVLDGFCNNSQAHLTLQTAPCVPVNVQAKLDCESGNVSVSWNASQGATGYSVWYWRYHQGIIIHISACNTTETMCVIRALPCGHEYNITVGATDDSCTSEHSSSITVKTAPCVPVNVQAKLDCGSGNVSVSWNASQGATGYSVWYWWSYQGIIIHISACNTTETMCVIRALPCGHEYNITVGATDDNCTSEHSSSISVKTAPCVPVNVQAKLDCESGNVSVSWNASQGATGYSVWYWRYHQGIIIHISACNTTETMCVIRALPCGHEYNITVSATDDNCTSEHSSSVSVKTAPCVPVNVQAKLDCESGDVSVSWNASQGATGYSVWYWWSYQGIIIHISACNTTETMCVIKALPCGQEYNILVSATDDSCTSEHSSSISVKTAPCVPVNVQAKLDCGSGNVSVSWNASQGATGYSVWYWWYHQGIIIHISACNTTETMCVIRALPCGHEYNITVGATDDSCTSEHSSSITVKTAPCVPVNVQAKLDCGSGNVSVSWNASQGATGYSVWYWWSYQGIIIHISACNTTETMCVIRALPCGHEYNITVGATDDNCTSEHSSSISVKTAPCVPVNVQAKLDCESGNVSVSWNASQGATGYSVWYWRYHQGIIIHISACNTTETMCVIRALPCGHEYNITVSATDDSCTSEHSSSITVKTAPCVPVNVQAKLDCESGDVSVSWNASYGATGYSVWYWRYHQGIIIHISACNTTETVCVIKALPCGHEYNITVSATDDNCTSEHSSSISVKTVPCVPQHVETYAECESHMGSVSWAPSEGADTYNAWAVGTGAETHVCVTKNYTCTFNDLRCGVNYYVRVTSQDNTCTSAHSNATVIHMKPCPPTAVNASLDCQSKTATVTWQNSNGSDSYIATFKTDGGLSETCAAIESPCSVHWEPCGQNISVSVIASNQFCNSTPSPPTHLQSVPCQPQGVNGSLDCVTNSAWVSWNPQPGVSSYTVMAVGDGGYNSSCSTSNSTCEVPDLACSVVYRFNVTASNGHCDSPPSASFDLATAPCSLSSITATAQCHNNSILVVWVLMEDGGGNTVYTAMAEGSDRSNLSCSSDNTSCVLTGARCGLRYTVIVSASSDSCSGLRSPPYRISMEPCPPQNVVITSDCEPHSALVSWTASPVAEMYLVTATGTDVRTCNSSVSNCSLEELSCGQQYNVSVSACNINCTSVANQNATFSTAPCPPAGLSVTVQCANQSAELSWTSSAGVARYYGLALAENGTALGCESAGSSCSIAGLECGAQYNVSVKVSDGTCNSSYSEPRLASAVPCPPSSVKVTFRTMRNKIQVLHVYWSRVHCPHVEYMLKLTGHLPAGDDFRFELLSDWTQSTFFEIPLLCDSVYEATVTARNPAGTSEPSQALSGTTAPCPPLNVTYTGPLPTATLSWSESLHADLYTVFDIGGVVRMEVNSTMELSYPVPNRNPSDLQVVASNSAGTSDPPANVTRIRP